METVAGEKPLELATSRMVTAARLPGWRFTVFSVAASSGKSASVCNGPVFITPYSAGASNDMIFRNPDVFHAPYSSPTATHTVPRVFAGVLSFHQIYAQIPNPSAGQSRLHAVFF